MLIEVRTFRLPPGASDGAFIDADEHLQQRLSSADGFLRRTTAWRADGERTWLELILWASAAHADDAAVVDARGAFDALVDAATVRVERFESLD